MRSYGGSVIGAQGIQGIKNVDSVLSICASTRRCHVRIETGRQKDGMPKDIDYRIGQEVQSARLVVPIFSLVAVSPFYQQDSASGGPCTHKMGSCCAVP